MKELKLIIIFSLLLILQFKNVSLANNEKKNYTGFGENEELQFSADIQKVKLNLVKDGKLYKKKRPIFQAGVIVKNNSDCVPFLHTNIFSLYKDYSANYCVPCYKTEQTFGIKYSKKKFCNLPIYGVQEYFKDAFKEGLVQEEMFPIRLKDIKPLEKKVLMRIYKISNSYSEEINFLEFRDKQSDEKYVVFKTSEFKTYQKKTAIKSTKWKYLDNQKFILFLNKIQTMTNIWEDENIMNIVNEGKEKKNQLISHETSKKIYDSLYKTLPNEEELELLYINFPATEGYHIQTRD
tara:strand:- start:707 stop:1585 length:879 start_codon:yes stop_codon:yes gene_type:complete